MFFQEDINQGEKCTHDQKLNGENNRKHELETNQSHSIPYPFFNSTSGAIQSGVPTVENAFEEKGNKVKRKEEKSTDV